MFALGKRIFHLRPANTFYKNGVKLLNSHFASAASNPNRYKRHKNNSNAVKFPIDDCQERVKGKDSELPYKIIDPNSARFTAYMTRAKNRRTRYQNKVIMLEGRRLINDALLAGVKPIMILFTRKVLIKNLPILDCYVTPERTVLHKIPYDHIQNWSNLTTSPGITGIFEMPDLSKRSVDFPTLPITLVCDNVREPGNLGAILRIAAATPVRKVMMLEGCVDLWDTKVTRSSCGAMFNLCIENNVTWDDVKETCEGNVIIADHLISEDTTESTIAAEDYPSSQDMEAAKEENEDDEDDDDDDDEEVELLDSSQIRKAYNVPVVPYHNVSYKNYDSFIIVIGGETEGLSEGSFSFAKENNGLRVNIPLAPCVNSLNTATALGIITFEIKRQLEST